MSISESGMLTIRGAVPEDAGNYTCLATNEAGTASQSVTVSYAGGQMLVHSKPVFCHEYITDNNFYSDMTACIKNK